MPTLYIAPSPIHGLGLFTARPIATGSAFIYVFNKIADTGDFTLDYLENTYGRYINHASAANAKPVLFQAGVAIEAIKPIEAREEITVNYADLIGLLADYPNVGSQFRFWDLAGD